MSSPDVPFVRRGGDDQVTSLYNRISALERIKHLTGVDLKDRSDAYKQLIDCELYQTHYKDLPPNSPIDEDWCQRVAEIVRNLEKEKKEDLDKTLGAVPERVKQLYNESKTHVPIPAPLKFPEKRKKWREFIKDFISKKV